MTHLPAMPLKAYKTLFQCQRDTIEAVTLCQTPLGSIDLIRIHIFIPAFDLLDDYLKNIQPLPIISTEANALEIPLPVEWGYFIESQIIKILKQFAELHVESWTSRYWQRTLAQISL